MRRLAWAVVKQSGLPYQFSVWHESKDLAIAEAERLCKHEGKTFLVLKLVAFSEIEEKPIKTTQWD